MKSPAPKPKKTDKSTRRSKPAPATSQKQTSALLQRALANPGNATSADILALQRTAGNRAVAQLLGRASNAAKPGGNKPPSLQSKLTVGPANDQYEQEADEVASHVLRMPDPAASPIEPGEAGIQRMSTVQRQDGFDEDEDVMPRREPGIQRDELDEEEDPNMMMKRSPDVQRADNEGSFEPGGDFEHRLDSSGGGKPLDNTTRSFMEPRFGADLGHVDVHAGSAATELNKDIGAQAFTHGSDIFFGAGKYAPGTSSGNQLIAHEITHTFQQGAAAKPLRQKPLQEGAEPNKPEQFEPSKINRQVIQRVGGPGYGMPIGMMDPESSNRMWEGTKAGAKAVGSGI